MTFDAFLAILGFVIIFGLVGIVIIKVGIWFFLILVILSTIIMGINSKNES